MSNTFYKRELPVEICVDFSSEEGQSIFQLALNRGFLKSYFQLSVHFLTQGEPAYCSLASLCMVLNALNVDPMRQWKGVWRFYSEEMLDCCTSLEVVKQQGITIPEFQCLADCNGLESKVYYSNESSVEEFRDLVKRSSALPSKEGLIVCSYDRRGLGQTGTGHFSPLAGYCEERDMVLILDVARFKYPPHWVKLTDLFNAMHTIDESTNKYRGYINIQRNNKESIFKKHSKLNINATGVDHWNSLIQNIVTPLSQSTSKEESLIDLYLNDPKTIDSILQYFSFQSGQLVDEHLYKIISDEIKSTKLFGLVKNHKYFATLADPHDQTEQEILITFLLFTFSYFMRIDGELARPCCKSVCKCSSKYKFEMNKIEGLRELLCEPSQRSLKTLTDEIEYIEHIYKKLSNFCLTHKSNQCVSSDNFHSCNSNTTNKS